jgi:hypothetical protein
VERSIPKLSPPGHCSFATSDRSKCNDRQSALTMTRYRGDVRREL